MIVITTPAGTIGHQVLENLLDSGEHLRLIARDLSGIPADLRPGVEVIEGSHGDPAVVDKAFDGADAVFWLAPPDPRADSVEAAYVGFTRPAAEAFRKHGVERVVGVSALGRGTPWAGQRRHLADWARKLPDFTEYRLPEMDAAGIDIQVLSLTVPGLQRMPSAYIGSNVLITTSGVFSPAALTGAVLEIGADAIMFAIDYPYESSHEAVAGLERTTLSDADRDKIAHGNAERILRL
jgi:hypothetical protein